MYDSNTEDLIQQLEQYAYFRCLDRRTVTATQCLICGHVEAPNADPLRCPSCGTIGADLHVFPATELS